MKNYQNQLDRFRAIAKRLVDDHCAELFSSYRLSTDNMSDDVYHSHLDVLGKQLDEHAQQFITTNNPGNESFRSEVWNTCKKYLEQFVSRSETAM